MKTLLYLVFFFFAPFVVVGQTIIEHQGIAESDIDLSNITTLGQITIAPDEAGKVIVHFNGECVSTPGDRIVLAASDTQLWSEGTGSVSTQAVSEEINRNTFSHTQVYEVEAGSQAFFAVAENATLTGGDGIASIYGNLSVEFYPNNAVTVVDYQEVIAVNANLTNPVTVGHISLNVSEPGKVLLQFDGNCISSPGDRIALGANDTEIWSINFNSYVEALNEDLTSNTFTNTQVFAVEEGEHEFYAVAQNYVELAGTGIASIYGNFTLEFIPDVAPQVVVHEYINETTLNVNNLNILGQVTVNAPTAGRVLVDLDALCTSSVGDRIVVAASDTQDWSVADGNVSIEAVDFDVNTDIISHTRSYDVSAGSHTFYAVAENTVETEGDGIISIYGLLTAKFLEMESLSTSDFRKENNVVFYPNPTTGMVNISFNREGSEKYSLRILDSNGKLLQTLRSITLESSNSVLSKYPNGVYYFQIIDDNNAVLTEEKIVKVN